MIDEFIASGAHPFDVFGDDKPSFGGESRFILMGEPKEGD
jgi:hypothetical protein